MQQHGPWFIKSSRSIYADRFVQVRGDEVIRPDGLDGHHVVVTMKAGVCVIAMDDEQNVYLTDEFHYGIGRHSWEGASGGIELEESPLQTAQRELEEELGILADDWLDLGIVDPFTTIVVSPTRLYLARRLKFVETRLEGTEQIIPVKRSLADAVAGCLSGAITHAPTCVALLKIQLLANSERLG
jgi:ADP-ribose pyrophosphatase